MNHRHLKVTGIGISLAGLVLLLVFLLPRTASSVEALPASTTRQDSTGPLAPTGPVTATGIYGLVTFQGIPIGGIQLSLFLCDYMSPNWACLTKHDTTTQPDGAYQFTNAPSLGTLQKYFVRFENDAYNPGYINYWYAPSIYSYTQGANIPGGDFDIAAVPLVSPADRVTVTLQYSFTWTLRVATPSDNYQFFLADPNSNRNWTAAVGYAGNYILEVLPPGFVANTLCYWFVEVKSPDGGSGATNPGRWVAILGPTFEYKVYLPLVSKTA
jgi:hypothetical protein